MLRLGFDNGWVELVMRCVSFVSYYFILNGQVQGALTPSRGIRQGDPFSPYLFVICAHGFSELLIDFERKKLFKGVKIAPSCPSITHLFFADDSLIFCRAKRADCFQLRQCLILYEKASGQSINFDKSTLSFSPNTGEMDREEICAMFGVTQVEDHDMYLGVPTFFMRNKRLQFGYIRDRVFKKLQGWKEKNFSQGGKEVLLKAVIQAIPIYAMLSSLMALDLSVFNQAMIGKQVWRLVTRPFSLAARVLKAKYYPNSSIWEADANDSSSYTWKSILWGRNLVAQGTRWRVGNGESISIYQSRWVPIPWSFRISSPAVLPATSKVSDMLQEDGRWNETLIRSSFLEFEADTILNLPRPSSRVYDSYCWHYKSKGSYSVKSGYRLGIEASYLDASSPSNNITSSWWNTLWSSNLPPKVRIFWWRIVNDIIPTSLNLRIHHVPTDLSCFLCGYGMESTVHALFLCPMMKRLWKNTRWSCYLDVAKSGTMFDLAIWATRTWDTSNFEGFAMTVWQSWNLRNKLKHDVESSLLGHDLQSVEAQLETYQRSRSASASATLTSFVNGKIWHAPPPSHFRLDVDASYSIVSGTYGVGGVIRDCSGVLVVASCWPGLRATSVEQADFLLDKIWGCCKAMGDVSFHFVPREYNRVAHSLARHALGLIGRGIRTNNYIILVWCHHFFGIYNLQSQNNPLKPELEIHFNLWLSISPKPLKSTTHLPTKSSFLHYLLEVASDPKVRYIHHEFTFDSLKIGMIYKIHQLLIGLNGLNIYIFTLIEKCLIFDPLQDSLYIWIIAF
ncbi:hypothetical protein UlMin_044677 [Ulmus minor]